MRHKNSSTEASTFKFLLNIVILPSNVFIFPWGKAKSLKQTQNHRLELVLFPGGGGGLPYEMDGDARRKF